MKFKIEDKASEGYIKVQAFYNKVFDMRKDNHKALQKFTGIEYQRFAMYNGPWSLNGDIRKIEITEPEQRTKDWVQSERTDYLYLPNKRTKRGKEIYKFMKNLPRIDFREENALFPNLTTEDPYSIVSFGYHQGINDIILLDVQDFVTFDLLPGMVEITMTEYKQLLIPKDNGTSTD